MNNQFLDNIRRATFVVRRYATKASSSDSYMPSYSVGKNRYPLRILLLLFILNSCYSFAQFPKELDDICYDIGFRCVTTNIDPIEGIYSVSTESKILLGDEVIKQQQSEGDLVIYSNSKGNIRDYNNKFEFYRIGQTKTYDVNILWPEYNIIQHKRIRLENTDFFDASFSLNYEMPQLDLKERFGEYYAPGLKAKYTIHCKKILPDKEIVADVLASLEKRNNEESSIWKGSGFSISNNLIATNYHVIDKANKIFVTNEVVKDTILASVIASDKKSDIAIISVSNRILPTPKYSIEPNIKRTGTSIFVLGYPLTSIMGNEIKATSGIISSQSGYEGDESLYQISAPIQPGNSGGPLFDFNGNIIGIVCAHYRPAENVGYAIKIKYLLGLIGKNQISINEPTKFKESKKLPELVELYKSDVFQIICTK